MAPEIVPPEEVFHSSKPADMWALAMNAYELLTGHTIISADDQGLDILKDKTRLLPVIERAYQQLQSQNVSWQGRQFLASLLDISPEKRLKAEQAIDHEWFCPLYESQDHPQEYQMEKPFAFDIDTTVRVKLGKFEQAENWLQEQDLLSEHAVGCLRDLIAQE